MLHPVPENTESTQEDPNISFPKLVFSDETPKEEMSCNLVHSTLANSIEQQHATPLEENINSKQSCGDVLDRCPACGNEFKSLMRHLKNQKCRDKLGESVVNDMRQKSKIAAKLKYKMSEKGRSITKKYQESEERKASTNTYKQSEKGMKTSSEYQQSEKRKESTNTYNQSDKRKECIDTYNQSEK